MRSDLQQLESVNRLLREVLPANPFYRRKAGGALPDFGSLEDFQREFPLTTRDEWVRDQLDHPPYGTNLTLPLGRYVRCHQTSGTSGRAMRWLDTREGWDRIVDDWATVLRKAGLGARDRYFFAFSFGPFLGFWSAFEAALRIGGLSLPGGGMPTLTRLQAIEENRITVLACTPTYALRMGEAAASTGLDTRKLALRCILVAGEPGGSLPGVRRRLERLWPTARIFDHHGMTETGPATYQCPREAGTLHCIDGSFHAEALRLENGAPARPGEQGGAGAYHPRAQRLPADPLPDRGSGGAGSPGRMRLPGRADLPQGRHHRALRRHGGGPGGQRLPLGGGPDRP